jgi:diamine N-acetyltransferase
MIFTLSHPANLVVRFMTIPTEPLAVSLRRVDSENFHAVLKLSVRDDQTHFVASNVYSIAESKINPEMNPLAIYAGETLVGFCMFGHWSVRNEYWIMRLMIDQQFQGNGYGRAAMQQIISALRAAPGCDRILISYEPENDHARRLYASLGFVITGEMLGGEEVARLSLR